ncbi:cytochrome P450 2J2 [Protobothrops mucrosquamatus]|uniref:cytochrome P450 2J2 n=1 Tax=Protobothrops mucrosquamatus TaxID=103944 RepID=UPI0010FB83C1|nr:cytochrome P450 2J2 [Protobothrops mucrosquamatus]
MTNTNEIFPIRNNGVNHKAVDTNSSSFCIEYQTNDDYQDKIIASKFIELKIHKFSQEEDKLKEWLDLENLIAEEQAGFREGRGTINQCLVLHHLIEKYASNRPVSLYAAFIDLKAAFDTVTRTKLWEKLEAASIDHRVLHLLHALHNKTSLKISQHVKRYGNISTLWAGPHLLVVLSGFKTVKEGLISFPEEFSDRPDDPLLAPLGKEKGIIFSSGHTWKQQRHFGITSLRKLGLGKKSIEHQIEDAAQTLVDIFRQTKEQPFDPSFPVLNAVSNITCALSFGHPFAPEDENFQKLIQALNFLLNFASNIFHMIYHEFPQLMNYLPGPHQKALASRDLILSFAKQEIEKHKEFHALHEPQDFIDYYLLQMEKSRNDPDSTYSDENLVQCILDFFVAGIDSTLATLMWALLFLTNHPDIQEKVKKEIEDVFGFSGSISYQDRKKLPYTNAVIHEMQRVKYILLVGVPRRSTKDVKMRGYLIPKVRNMVRLHSRTPKEFNPNHFLDKDGKFIEREEFLPFGIGQRVCMGQQLARIEMFIFLISLLRAFSFRLPEGVKELNEAPVVKVTMHPHPYKFCAIPTKF